MFIGIVMKEIQEGVQLGTEVAMDFKVVLLDMFLSPSPLKQALHFIFECLALDFLPGTLGKLRQVTTFLVLH